MSIAIIISTHGEAAQQLLKTTEMILGKQKNTACINFMPGENTETLNKKYTTSLKNLKITNGVLFLVDTWGGSPFNAAYDIIVDKTNYEIITGINIPMLIEIFMIRDDNISFQTLVKTAIKIGRDGIKNTKITNTLRTLDNNATKNIKSSSNSKKHMTICLTRIDDRLIHGQVVTTWAKEIDIKRIIVINNEVAADSMRKTLLTQVSPPGITAHAVDTSKAVRVYNNAKYAKDRVMLLFTNPTDIVNIFENGIQINTVNIGGMAFKKGKIKITNAVSIDEKDIKAFKKLHTYGIKLEIQKVPSESALNIMDLIKKLEK